ncbi:hypothetical protein OJ997_04610 [Solirubrobacter phytolaccae]|uniref:Uncharacterized protein n=1 Tax=Solirubrobacter phytolaccae TaxID=1404360 RepID=A0A9X3SDB4_9ACTN|nr:hypothetical protein [Solirubrobacter phytolaccae]MDA0179567.1 hypothetical protein [Solirubrobacter phytolaccae]
MSQPERTQSARLLRWRLRSGHTPGPDTVIVVRQAIESALADPELWRIRTEDEILARYAKAGFEVQSLEDVRTTVSQATADKLALVGARPVALPRQFINRRKFRGRLADEIEQLLSEACTPLVHNAAVYGYRADRASAIPVLAAALDPAADDLESLALGLARAKDGAGPFTGMRPLYGDFNAWYLSRVSRTSRSTFRERFARDRA